MVAVVRKTWLTTCWKPGWRCSEMVGSSWHEETFLMPWAVSPHAMRNIRSWHLQTTLFERRSPPFQHVGIHPFRTSASMLAEGGMFSYKKPPRQSNALSIFQSNIAVLSLENFSFAVWRKHTEYQHYRFGFWLSLTEIRVLIIDKIQVLQLKATSKDYTFRSNKKNSLNLLFQDDI